MPPHASASDSARQNHGHNTNSASDPGTHTHLPAASALTKKKQRELKLRADPLVEVVGPTLVRCLNCGKDVKLSTKSEWDASHWTRHRGRCLKRRGDGAPRSQDDRAVVGKAAGTGRGRRAGLGSASGGRAIAEAITAAAGNSKQRRDRERDASPATSDFGSGTSSPASSSRAATPEDGDAYEIHTGGGVNDWKSWDWSKLRSPFFPQHAQPEQAPRSYTTGCGVPQAT